MKTRKHLIAPLMTLLLVGSACTTIVVEAPTTTASPEEVGSSEVAAPAPTTNPQSPSASDALKTAIDDILGAGSYAFASTVDLFKDQPTTIAVTGWVDGSDRELVVTSGEQSITTLVKDGVATITKDGETIEVPLSEANDAPSLEILTEIKRPAFSDPMTITGSLSPSSLRSTGFDSNGSADVIVRLSVAGELEGYNLATTNGSWSIDVTFSSVGEDFSS